jgi:hypothetical protein
MISQMVSKLSDHLINEILVEMARLSMLIYQGVPAKEASGLAMIINHLVAVLAGKLSINDFHDHMAGTPQTVREFYYKLLFEEK